MGKKPVDIKSIFFEALRRKNAAERVAYLDGACGKDTILRAEVESLLKSHEKAGDFLPSPDLGTDVTLGSSPLTEGSGTVTGNYKLLEQIGEGGMAVVYMAEQEKPLRRRVALKIIKLGMDTKQVIARFEVERQALAVMDHPNIAKVLDAGTTETGRPYFVMELVRGVSISEYCDKNKLSTKERLDLFVQVCNAVQHAHQKGIIHRDIKPSNVMVTLHDGKPVPKVIDFGIAKATSQKLTEKTLFTRYAQMIGTPAYMSPEQAEMSGLDIDTRTDIYSLGVLLYELLTGGPPFGKEQLREAGYLEMQRIILEQEPLRPSTKLSTLGDTLTDVAEHRKASPALLQKLIRGDLDWIVMKSLEKDRTRRYNTAAELVADIERHLNHDPVLAGPPSTIYRLKKLLRKYRTQAIAVATAAVLLACIAVIFVMYVRAVSRGKEAEFLEHKDILSKAMELRSSGQFQDALAEIEKIVDSEHVGPKARLLRSRLVLELEGPAAAVKELQKLLNERDEIACQAHFLLARIYLESDPGDPEATEEYVQKAKEHQQKGEQLFSESAEAYFNRSMMVGTVDKTLEWLNKALERNPSHCDSLEARALAYYALKEYDQMEIDAFVMIGIKPKDSHGYALRAIARREKAIREDNKEFLDQAIKDHYRAIRISPKEAGLYDERRQTYMRMGNYEQVLSDARKCAELEPKEGIYHFHIFCALVASGLYEEAKVKYDTIIKSHLMTKSEIDLSAAKYVSDTLDAGLSWYRPHRRPEGAAFLAMQESAEIYEQLAKKAKRVVAEGFHATWSPDGTELAYSCGIHGFSGIEIINLESGKTHLLTVPGFDPAWSPDGDHIAYVRSRQTLLLAKVTTEYGAEIAPYTQREVWIIKADGTAEPRFLTRGHFPCWSRDSKRVFYYSPNDTKVYSISIGGGTKPKPLISCPSDFPVVSPDEKYVAYMLNYEVRIVDLSTKSVVASWTLPRESGGGVNWSPNGRELSSGSHENTGLWIYELDTKKASKVLSGPIGWSSWSRPDMSRFAFQRMYGPLYREIWVADIESNVSTIEALGPGRTIEEHYQEMVDYYTRRINVNPEDEDNYLSLDILLKRQGLLGIEHYPRGAYKEALLTLTRIDKLRRTVLNNKSLPRDIAFIMMALHQLGRDQEAEAALDQLWRLFEDGNQSHQITYLREAEQLLAGKNSNVYLVWECIEAGKLEEASQLIEELRLVARQKDIEITRGVQRVIEGLAIAYYNRGKGAKHVGRGYDDAISDYESAVHVDPSYAPALGELAWLLATCPRVEFRDGAKAIENAIKACELTDWKNYSYFNVLAGAYAEAGDFQQAIRRQKEAIDLLPEDKRSVLQSIYEERLKLYVSGKPYHKGLIGWWKFDGNGRDSSPFQHDGTEMGKPTYAAGINGQAVALRGDGDHVLVYDAGAWLNGLDALTVCLWVKSNVTGTDKGFIIFEDPDDADNRDMRYDAAGAFGGGMNLIKSGVSLDEGRGPDDWLGRQQLESSNDVQTTEWQHLGMTWSSGNQVRLYINAVEDRTEWRDPIRRGILTGYTKLIIGKGCKDVEANESWNGLIDDVRIYSYALSEEEIKAIYEDKEPPRNKESNE